MKTMTGECKFCKQINAFEWVGDKIPTKEELTEAGTNACECEAAKDYRDREYRVNAVCESLDRILPDPEEAMAKKILKDSAMSIAMGQIYQIAINIGNGTKVKMQQAGEAIKVQRTDTSSRTETT